MSDSLRQRLVVLSRVLQALAGPQHPFRFYDSQLREDGPEPKACQGDHLPNFVVPLKSWAWIPNSFK